MYMADEQRVEGAQEEKVVINTRLPTKVTYKVAIVSNI